MKKALILGAGMVAKPMIDYLLDCEYIEVILASRTVSKAENILGGRDRGRALPLQVDNDSDLEKCIIDSDIVVSLLPYTYHVKVAKYCIKHKKSLVTTSYVSREMKDLDQLATKAGILILNEIGLDPGIDHMSAMKIINAVHENGGEVKTFNSYCGGLPAPEANTNPWGYKFSWSPRGVLMAGRNDAKFLKDGSKIEIEGCNLFKNVWPIQIEDLELETYPNRDSLPYINLYGIPESSTVYRGTLRYPGWCRTLLKVVELGLLMETKLTNVRGHTHREIMCDILSIPVTQDPKFYIAEKTELDLNDEIIKKLEWLNIFSSETFPLEITTPIDFLSYLMLKKMRYGKDERDMIVLHHDFLVFYPDKKEHITSTLIDYGIIGGDSAMSRTVSLPAAIAVNLILDGKIEMKGVKIPVDKEIYLPILAELEQLGIICNEKQEVLSN